MQSAHFAVIRVRVLSTTGRAHHDTASGAWRLTSAATLIVYLYWRRIGNPRRLSVNVPFRIRYAQLNMGDILGIVSLPKRPGFRIPGGCRINLFGGKPAISSKHPEKIVSERLKKATFNIRAECLTEVRP
jgi:hypothetical protein